MSCNRKRSNTSEDRSSKRKRLINVYIPIHRLDLGCKNEVQRDYKNEVQRDYKNEVQRDYKNEVQRDKNEVQRDNIESHSEYDNETITEIALNTDKVYKQIEVTALLERQEQQFRIILEEKLREQFNAFNQLYIDNVFKEYKAQDFSYIN
jgi:hypothetical protein